MYKGRLLSRRELLKRAGTGTAGLLLGTAVAKDVSADRESAELYNEKYRPQFHFTPRKNWTNDPNGLVYYKGTYHLFFQHNPFGINWGNMTWGHAVSKDLLHWKQLAHAIKPDELGTIFSGSAVVDWKNTSGFQSGSENVLVAFYTAAGEFAKPEKKKFTQCLAYSNDRGITWVKYKNNPIIGNIRDDDRDPKVIWHEQTNKWVMVLFLDKDREFAILTSKNLIDWDITQILTLDGSRECPDFFPLEIEGEPGNDKWVFWGAYSGYKLGSFDGKQFSPETERFVATAGQYYAAQTYSDIPESDGRRIQIGWLRGGKFPDMPFNQQMSFPVELKLRRFDDGLKLCLQPIEEIELIRKKAYSHEPKVVSDGDANMFNRVRGELLQIQAEFSDINAKQFGLKLRGKELLYDAESGTLDCEGTDVKVKPIDGKLKLHILIDRTSIEVFANRGRESIFRSFPLDTENKSLILFVRDGSIKVQKADVWQLESTWT